MAVEHPAAVTMVNVAFDTLAAKADWSAECCMRWLAERGSHFYIEGGFHVGQSERKPDRAPVSR